MNWILIILIFTTPVYVTYRLINAGAPSLFNFCLYPLIFAYFYLLIPAIIPFVSTLGDRLSLSSDSFSVIDQLSVWYVFVFFVTYIISNDMNGAFNSNVRFAPISLWIAKLVQSIVVFLMLFILIKHGPVLLALSGDRGLSYDYFAREIIDVYKLPVLWSFTVITSSLLYFHYKHWFFLVPVVTFAVLDALQGGRGYTFAAVSVVGLNYLAMHMDRFKRTIIFLSLTLGFVFASAFVRRFLIVDDTSDPLVIFFGEFFFTRLTAQITYDNLASSGDLWTYMLLSISKMFPQFIVAPLFSEIDLVPYHVRVNEWADAGFGLAGSVMAEALYYGGVVFAVISPLLISGLFLVLSRTQFARSLTGYLFFLVITSSMYLIFRSGFYAIFFSTIYVFVFYFSLIIYPSIRQRIFIPLRRNV